MHDALTPSDVCKTLNTLDDPMKVVCSIGFNGWQSHTSNMPILDEKIPTIEATMPPNVMHDQQSIFCIDQGGGKSGANVSVDQTPTLTTTHQGEPAVCYALDRASFNQGQNAKYDISIQKEIAQPIVARGPGG